MQNRLRLRILNSISAEPRWKVAAQALQAEEGDRKSVPLLLILDSLGTSELLVILAVALIFFGPRKLPQISRQIGKSLAEFRKASDEFKSTWAREVALESESQADPWQPTNHSSSEGAVDYSAPANTIAAGQEIAQPNEITTEATLDNPEESHLSAVTESAPVVPARKSDWL